MTPELIEKYTWKNVFKQFFCPHSKSVLVAQRQKGQFFKTYTCRCKCCGKELPSSYTEYITQL